MTGAADPQDCPYVGLDPFDKAYEDFFFGRKRDSRVLADHVLSRQVTVLYGPSGVGKSSVLRAGVVQTLRVEGHSAAQNIYPNMPEVVPAPAGATV